MRWIESNGGPLIAIPANALDYWMGATGASSADYGRACAVDDYVGLIQVGGTEALVLGDEPLRTTWLPDRAGGVIARWVFAPDEESAVAAITDLPPGVTWSSSLEWEVAVSPVVLLDSAEKGTGLGTRLSMQLPPGRYRVETTRYSAAAETQLLLHRVRRMRGKLG